jgi:hypothetical protein
VRDFGVVMSRQVVSTPPHNYDDSYSIRYAQDQDGYVVTNDLFRSVGMIVVARL